MAFASPLWLLGLVPWAGVVVWLLLGKRRRLSVPFVPLWRGVTPAQRAKPFLTPPSPAVLLAIVSLLLIVFASAHPVLRSRSATPVTIIVDRGITMSARGARMERFKETSDRVASMMTTMDAGSAAVKLVSVPGGEQQIYGGGDWTAAVAAMLPTAQDSRALLAISLRHALSDGDRAVLVITDQPVMNDPHVIQIEPEHAASNLTITNVAARARPHPQVMVELRDQNCAEVTRTPVVSVESGGHHAQQNVNIARNTSESVFIDLPSLGDTIAIAVDAEDDLPADNRAWLAQEARGAIIDDSPMLPKSLRRMIAVYRSNRGVGGRHIEIVTNAADAPADLPSVVVPSDLPPVLPTADLNVEAHPIAASVNWPAAIGNWGGALPPSGYRPIVAQGEEAFVAVRDQPERSVWIDLESPDWPKTPDYVIFWTDVFDWLAGEGDYRWHPVENHAPGIEKGSDGAVRAYNAIDVNFPPPHPSDWSRLKQVIGRENGSINLTPGTATAALALMAVAMLITFKRSKSEG